MEVDWMYRMRREMQEILPGLYLGPYNAATKCRFNTLLDHGITHIICVRHSIEAHMVRANFPDKIKYLVLDMADNMTQNLIGYLAECRRFIDECLLSGGKCLVHGNLGISRSAAIVVAYVMEKKGITYKESLEFVQNRRYCINPNDGFKQQLREYEAIYRAQQTFLLNGQCSQKKVRLKRKHEQTMDLLDSEYDGWDDSNQELSENSNKYEDMLNLEHNPHVDCEPSHQDNINVDNINVDNINLRPPSHQQESDTSEAMDSVL